MAFKLTFETNNDAFTEADEVSQILYQIANIIAADPFADFQREVIDSNGNRVGSWHLNDK